MSLLVMDGFTSVFFLQDKAEGGDLYQHLRCQRQSRQRYDSYNRPGQLIEALMSGRWQLICLSYIGDWELDTIMGQGRAPAVHRLIN